MFLQTLYTFLASCFLVLFVEFLILNLWFSKRKEPKVSAKRLGDSAKLPEPVKDSLLQDDGKIETCVWFNSILSFLFDEWRDSIEAKQVIMNKFKKEFDELLSKALGKLVKDLTVREYTLGTSLPTVHEVQVLDKKLTPDGSSLQELDILLDVEYSGNFELAVDADVLFHKSAFVVIKVCYVKGSVVMKFTKEPFSHWSFSFKPDAVVRLSVTAEVEGRNVPQIANVIENQLHKVIQKKHTLPNRKARFKPFLPPQVPRYPSQAVYYEGLLLSNGDVEVEIIQVEKFPQPTNVYQVYCTVSLDLLEYVAFSGLPMSKWTVNEVKVEVSGLTVERILGVRFHDVYVLLKDERQRVPAVHQIENEHLASSYGICVNDILDSMNGSKVSCVKDTEAMVDAALHSFRFLRPPNSAMIIPRQSGDISRKGVKQNETFQTRLKSLSRTMRWGQSCTFVVSEEEESTYMNVCIWGLVKEDRKELLLGKVSMKLTDIALKCTMTSSNTHQEKLFLVPSEALQAIMNRKANESSKEMMGRVSLNVKLPAELKAYNFFPGSIILEFHYEPSQDQQSASSNVSDDEHSDNVSTTSRQGTFVVNTSHAFEPPPGRKDITKVCSICQKKYKSALMVQCRKCGLLCDRRCSEYCKKEVKCSNDPMVTDDDILEEIGTNEKEDVDETVSKIRSILSKLKNDLETVEDSDEQRRANLGGEIVRYTQMLEELDKQKWQNRQ